MRFLRPEAAWLFLLLLPLLAIALRDRPRPGSSSFAGIVGRKRGIRRTPPGVWEACRDCLVHSS